MARDIGVLIPAPNIGFTDPFAGLTRYGSYLADTARAEEKAAMDQAFREAAAETSRQQFAAELEFKKAQAETLKEYQNRDLDIREAYYKGLIENGKTHNALEERRLSDDHAKKQQNPIDVLALKNIIDSLYKQNKELEKKIKVERDAAIKVAKFLPSFEDRDIIGNGNYKEITATVRTAQNNGIPNTDIYPILIRAKTNNPLLFGFYDGGNTAKFLRNEFTKYLEKKQRNSQK